jgi:transposase
MKRFIEGGIAVSRRCVDESNPVRAVDTFVDRLDLAELGFKDVEPATTGQPGYHPVPLLKLYIYGYLI